MIRSVHAKWLCRHFYVFFIFFWWESWLCELIVTLSGFDASLTLSLWGFLCHVASCFEVELWSMRDYYVEYPNDLVVEENPNPRVQPLGYVTSNNNNTMMNPRLLCPVSSYHKCERCQNSFVISYKQSSWSSSPSPYQMRPKEEILHSHLSSARRRFNASFGAIKNRHVT